MSAHTAADIGADIGCGALYDRLIQEEQRQHEADKQRDHDEHAQEKADQDRDSGGDQDGDDASEDDDVGVTSDDSATSGPSQVTGLGAGASGGAIWLGWSTPAGDASAISYRVLRAEPDGVERLVATVNGNAYVDRNGISGRQYSYRVEAVIGTKVGPASEATNARFP